MSLTLALGAAAQSAEEPAPQASSELDAPVVPPALIGEARADYPEGARGSALVLLHLVIDLEGAVSDVTVLSGAEPFAGAAERSARSWRFVPARRGDTPIAARIRIELRFAEPVNEPPPIPSLREPAPAPPAPAANENAADEEVAEVLVLGKRSEPNTRTFTRAEVRQLPGAFGDPFRAIEALPGVTPIASGIPFFYVRGAPPGNVGYFLDGIRVPLLYHVGLGPSVVHPGMVDEVDLYPAAYPARYGRFAGGIVAGETGEPATELRGEWQLRPFDAGAMIELPFAGDRAYVLAGGRYSYTAFVISLFADDVRLEYWDYQLRAGYRLSESDTLSVFSFGSFDYFGEDTGSEDDAFLSTEFHRVDLRYDHGRGRREQLRSAITLGFDRSRNGDDDGALIDRRIAWRNEYENQLGPRLRLRAGADAALEAFSVDPPEDFDDDPGARAGERPPGASPTQFPEDEEDDEEAEFRRAFPTRRDFVAGAYVDLVWQIGSRITLIPGVRSDVYASNGAVAVGVDPRIAVTFKVGERWTLKHALGIAHQPPSFVVPVPGFEIGGLRGGLQQSVQASAGVDYRLPDDMRLSMTLFHNLFFKLSDLLSLVRSEEALPDSQLDIDSRTRGQAYGLELMFQRDLTRRLGGFLSYTLSRSERFTTLGRIPSAFDRSHVASGALAYDLGRRWRAGGRLTFYTGTPASIDVIDFVGEGQPVYSQARRLSPFYRLDVRLEKRWPIGNRGAWWAFVFEVLNTTLNRELINTECDAFGCDEERIGPVTVPSLGLEGGF